MAFPHGRSTSNSNGYHATDLATDLHLVARMAIREAYQILQLGHSTPDTHTLRYTPNAVTLLSAEVSLS